MRGQFEPRRDGHPLAQLNARPQRAFVVAVPWSVDDLTPIVAALEIDSKPFFGPVRRADGVFQLYVELPYHHYLEIDSLTFDGTVGTPSARAWAEAV